MINQFIHEVINTSTIVQNHLEFVAKYLVNNSFDTTFFDPPFGETLSKDGADEYTQEQMIKEWTDIAAKKTKTTGQIIAINTNGGIGIVRQKLKEYNFYEHDKITVGTSSRGYKKDPNIYISIFKKNKSILNNIRYNNIHIAGEHNVTEAPREWLIHSIFNHIGRKNIGTSVFDMFGGSGNIPQLCKVFNIICLSIEVHKPRYDNIIKRLNKPSGTCLIATCSNEKKCRGLCENHYQRAFVIKNAFLGLDSNFNPVLGFHGSVTTAQLIELGYQSIQRAQYESNSRTTNGLEGSIQRRINNSRKSTEKI